MKILRLDLLFRLDSPTEKQRSYAVFDTVNGARHRQKHMGETFRQATLQPVLRHWLDDPRRDILVQVNSYNSRCKGRLRCISYFNLIAFPNRHMSSRLNNSVDRSTMSRAKADGHQVILGSERSALAACHEARVVCVRDEHDS